MILSRPTDERFSTLFDALRQGMSLEEIAEITRITPFFLEKIKNIVDLEQELAKNPDEITIRKAKQFGFSDSEITRWWTPVRLNSLHRLLISTQPMGTSPVRLPVLINRRL